MEGVAARASDQALSRLGQAATWLMPRRAAKVRITEALADKVAEKIRAGNTLDEAELFFVAQLFEKEGRFLGNREAAAEEIQRVLPEVNDRLKELPPVAQDAPSEGFFNRAEGVASEISEDEIRQVFSRLVAGEICRPGSFSLRTLEAVRSLDARNARAFDELSKFVFDGDRVIIEGDADEFLVGRGLNLQARLDLQDAGLIQGGTTLAFQKGLRYSTQYGERQLRVTIEQGEDSLSTIWLSLLRLTRIGQELAAVLPFNPDYDYFDIVSAILADKVGDHGIVEHTTAGAKEWTRVDTTKAG